MFKLIILILIATPVYANKITVPVVVTVYNGNSLATTGADINNTSTVIDGVKAY